MQFLKKKVSSVLLLCQPSFLRLYLLSLVSWTHNLTCRESYSLLLSISPRPNQARTKLKTKQMPELQPKPLTCKRDFAARCNRKCPIVNIVKKGADGSAIGAAVHTNTGAAAGHMHVMHCIWTGGMYEKPYLSGLCLATHGL